MPLVGPLGWPYPLLNLLLSLVEELKRGRSSGLMPSSRPLVSNIEEVTWTDWRGRERRMSIRREVR